MLFVYKRCVSWMLLFVFLVEFVSFGLSDVRGPGEPLYLTPLIAQGRLKEARRSALVKPFVKGVKSYSGYFTVNENYNSNLFFWFFKAEHKNWRNLPLAVWLQGGPGGSSLVGLFVENGPYILKDKKLHKRHYSWHKKCNMIYIDNPVGSGFSFTEHDEGYARNQTVIGEQLYSALKQFLILFPVLHKNEVFLAGESYAGKYIPAFAYTIYKRNMDSFDINLKGLFIGNGAVDPPNMMVYGDYAYQLGLIDTNTLRQFHSFEHQIHRAVVSKSWRKATELFGKMVLDSKSLFKNVTGFHEHFNYVNLSPRDWTNQHTKFVSSDLFRRTVHVGNKDFDEGEKAAEALNDDIVKSVVIEVEELLNHYRIVFYNGELDVICAYPLMVNFIKKMKWPSAHSYATAERHIWRVKNKVAGYYKIAGNLMEVLVRDAGHMVPTDQPLWANLLFYNFVLNKDFQNDEL